jgi:hypothetical protein
LHHSALPPEWLAIFKYYQGRNTLHLVLAGSLWIFIYIHFYNRSGVADFFFYFLRIGAIILQGPHHSAENHQHWFI